MRKGYKGENIDLFRNKRRIEYVLGHGPRWNYALCWHREQQQVGVCMGTGREGVEAGEVAAGWFGPGGVRTEVTWGLLWNVGDQTSIWKGLLFDF